MRLSRVLSNPVSFAVAIVCVAALTLVGGLYAHRNLQIVHDEVPEIEAGRLRDGIVTFGDLHRVTLSLASAGEVLAPAETGSLRAALDYLYVRVDTLEKAFGDQIATKPGDSPARRAAIHEVRTLIALLKTTIETGDAALSEAPVDAAARRQVISAIEDTNRHLIKLVNRQQHAQLQAISTQSEALLNMTLSAAGLLVFFAAISVVTLAVLRAEIRARRDRHVAEKRANHLAYFDQMTGLSNRTRFTERLEDQLTRRARGCTLPLIALVDLDGFKAVNDTHGHGMGDAMLKAVADRIQKAVEPYDGMAARLGGDEFAVIATLEPTDNAHAEFCRRILDAIRAPLNIAQIALAPRASIGLAVADSNVASVTKLLKRADLALYEAKELGRDTFVVYDDQLDARAELNRAYRRDLAHAIGRGEMYLVYQPQVRISDGSVYGFEALVRWRRPDGDVLPSEFIGIAEQTGLIIDIDLWGLRTATRQLAEWRAESGVDATISVNLSALHFRGDSIVESVSDALLESGLPAHLLTLEITETLLVEDWEHLSGTINALHRLGVRIALDDFGSGYSSLNYLRQIGADLVKIDRSFLRDLEGSSEARTILANLVRLTSDLGMNLLVEGVETPMQRAMLLELGCSRAQGFLFSQPVTDDIAGAMLNPPRAA